MSVMVYIVTFIYVWVLYIASWYVHYSNTNNMVKPNILRTREGNSFFLVFNIVFLIFTLVLLFINFKIVIYGFLIRYLFLMLLLNRFERYLDYYALIPLYPFLSKIIKAQEDKEDENNVKDINEKIASSIFEEVKRKDEFWDSFSECYKDVPEKKILVEIYYIKYFKAVETIFKFYDQIEEGQFVKDMLTDLFVKFLLSIKAHDSKEEYLEGFDNRVAEIKDLSNKYKDDEIDATKYYFKRIDNIEKRLGTRNRLPISERLSFAETLLITGIAFEKIIEFKGDLRF